MRTMPEHGPSQGSEVSEGAGISAPVLGSSETLQIVPKSRLVFRENVAADRVFRGIVLLCALAVLAMVALIFLNWSANRGSPYLNLDSSSWSSKSGTL
jgi:hypothetical protein